MIKQYNVFRPLTEFESLWKAQEQCKLMSKLYYSIFLSNLPHKDTVKDRWERDLLVDFLEDERNKLKRYNQSLSRNVSILENRFKTINRWSLTPN